MKPMKATILLVALVVSTFAGYAQEKYSKVKVYVPQDRLKKAALIGLLEIDHFSYSDDGAIISEIGADLIPRLAGTGYRYEILVDDVAQHIEEYNRMQSRLPFEQHASEVDDIIPTPAAFQVKATLGGYYSFAEMNTAMNQLIAAYGTGPNKIAKKFSIGQTQGGRDIWVIKISDNVDADEAEPEVLFMGLQHAREAIGGSSMIMTMQYLCENYATNQRVKELVNNREIFIIVCMNPDGYEYNRSIAPNGGGGWRKNRNSSGGGVDLNRNWGVDWGNCSAPITGLASSCGSGSPGSDTYYGSGAFSELETQHVRNFAKSQHLVAMVDQHAYGPYYSLPFGRPSLPGNVMSTEDARFYTYVPAAMGKYNGMRAGNSPESVGYEVAGGVKDWMLKGEIGTGINGGYKGKIYGMTGEGGYGRTLAQGGTFWPPSEQIIQLCKGMVYQNLQLIAAVGPLVDLQDNSDMIITTKSGTMPFRARRVGVGTGVITVELIPMDNITTGPAVPIPPASIPNYYDSYTGSVPYTLPSALTNGQRVRFKWKVNAGGVIYEEIITKYYHATPATMTLMHDNMESGTASTNWTISSGWGYTSNGTGLDGTGRALSESPSGLYANSANTTAQWNGTFNLSTATSAHISFWVRHRAENFHDKMQVQISRNGTSWTAIPGTTTIQEPGTLEGSTINGVPAMTGIRENWTRVLYDLKDFIGGSANNAIRFRFNFTSDGSGTSDFDYRQDDGFYIDEVKLLRSTAGMVTLPVNFTEFTGTLLQNETVLLKWAAQTDQLHDRFEVEKSADGSNWTTIGTGPNTAPYSFNDKVPYIGNNFYRIRQYDKNGNWTYSDVVNVVYAPQKFAISVYPNPIVDRINIRIDDIQSTQYTISITDMTGRKVHEQQVTNSFTDRLISIPFQHQAAQMYLVTIRNSRNEIVASEKLTKH